MTFRVVLFEKSHEISFKSHKNCDAQPEKLM